MAIRNRNDGMNSSSMTGQKSKVRGRFGHSLLPGAAPDRYGDNFH
jgi:hypothetical protein